MFRLREVIDCLCEGEVVYPRIAQGQIQQLQKGDGSHGAVHNVQHQ